MRTTGCDSSKPARSSRQGLRVDHEAVAREGCECEVRCSADRLVLFQASSQVWHVTVWLVSLRCSSEIRCPTPLSLSLSLSLSPLLYGAFFLCCFNWVWPDPNYLIFFFNLIDWYIFWFAVIWKEIQNYIFWFIVNLTWVDLFLFVAVVETWVDFDWVVIFFIWAVR